MSDIARNVSLAGLIFGSNANTTIPASPNVGTPYRNTVLNKTTAGSGWPFATVVDSADFNEIMYRITSVLDAIEVQGILFWTEVTDYVAGSIVRRTVGTAEKFYEALQASGPASGPRDPADLANIGVYWKEASIGGGSGGGYAVQFVSTSINPLEKGNMYFCTAGGISLTLPTLGLMNGDKLKIATGRTIGLGTPVTVLGAIESPTGTADVSLVIDTPFSSVELVYNSASGLWKVCSPIARGVYIAASVPVGSVIAYAANAEPTGFFICDGRAVSRTTYSQLFSVLGTTYGAGDGSTTFNIPDFRGKFLRGAATDGTTAPIGSTQEEGLPNIKGTLTWAANSTSDGAIRYSTVDNYWENGDGHNLSYGKQTFNAALGQTDTDGNYVAQQDRIYGKSNHVTPINQAVNFIIKY